MSIQKLKSTPRVTAFKIRGQVVRVHKRKTTHRIKGAPQLMEHQRILKGTVFSIESVPDWSTSRRKQVEAVLLAFDSGMSWDEAVKVTQIDWVKPNDPSMF